MKKLVFSISSCFLAFGAWAQLPVSTTPENKNVVLEEFTGIYCQFCPDGHKLANDLKAANPGDVVLINVHTGGFAAPSGNDPDFRTPFGAALAGQSNLAGYPAGTINRREFAGNAQNGTGSAQSRGTWATTGAIVLGEASYANVALEADIDLTTNMMTVDVEVYFTGSSAPSEVLLNVALLQNNIRGPQTGGSTYYPAQVNADGTYNHQHMLRDLLTGQWGDTITTTSMGSLWSKTYTYPVPGDIGGVPVSVGDLEIVGFMTETEQTIVTGAYGPLTFTAPAGASIVDASLTDQTPSLASLCDGQIVPEVILTNNSATAIDSVEVSYTVNGDASTTVTGWYSGSLAQNATATITFPQITLPSGSNVIEYELSFNNVSKFFDLANANNIVSSATLSILPASVNPIFDGDDYESIALGGVPTDVILEDNSGRIFVVDQGISTAVNYDIGGWGASAKSLRFDFATIDAGDVSSMITEKFDFSGATAAEVEFDYAYALRGTITGDQLALYYSTDCGATWVEAWKKADADLATTTPTAANIRLYPQSNEWTFAEVQIPALNGEAEVIFKFEGTSGGGNALYLDNFNKDGVAIVSLDEETSLNGVSVFPNPATTAINIEINNEDAELLEVEVVNTIGQVVASESFEGQKMTINTQNFDAGVYIVTIKSGGKMTQERISIIK
jgi:hypothetical protein